MEKFVVERTFIYLGTAASFFVWQAFALAAELPNGDAASVDLLNGVSYLGVAVWAIFTYLLMRFHARLKREGNMAALNDEVSQNNFKRAIFVGYAAVVLTICVALALSGQMTLTLSSIARGLLVVAVVVPLIAFVVLEKRGMELDANGE